MSSVGLLGRGNCSATTTTTTLALCTSDSNNNGHRIRPPAWRHQRQTSHTTRTYQTSQTMETPPGVFGGVSDRFLGVTVDCKEESFKDTKEFSNRLEKSLDFWIKNKKRTIWFRVYTEQAELVPILAKAGFDFHRAHQGAVIMYRWLPTHESNNLPSYAHTMVGVGGLVINDADEVLVVSEKYALSKNSWKLPGGYVDPKENLIDSAIREVVEETGILTTFRSLVCLRHSHGGNFDCSDMYIVIALKPLNFNIKPCEREIARAEWMPIEKYLIHPNVHEANRHFVHTYLDYRKRGIDFTCESKVHKFLKKEYQLYYVEPDRDDKMTNQVQQK